MVADKTHSKLVVTLSWGGLALVVLISAISFNASVNYRSSTEWRIHSEAVLSTINELQSLVERAETAQRGYVLTESDPYLSPFDEAVESAHKLMEKTITLVADNPQQQKRARVIKEVFKKKIEVMRKPIELTKKQQNKEAIQFIRQGLGQTLMVDLRTKFDEFRQEEIRLLNERTVASEESFKRTNVISLLGILGAVAILSSVIILLQREIRQRTAVAEQLKIAEAKALEASELKTQFVANMSHEIRTPLNGVIGMTKLLAGTQLSTEQRALIIPLQDSANFLLSLINQVLDISKIESGKLQLEEIHFELRSLVQSTFSMLEDAASAKGLRLSFKIDDSVPDIFLGDPLRIRQIFLNLLSNSIKFSSKGTVSLWAGTLGDKDSESLLIFHVEDQGIGIDEQTRTRLFQSFTQGDESTTRKYGGTGLGLSISKQLVELMRGSIKVESTEGVGSRFIFEIHLKQAKYSADQLAFNPKDVGQITARVLVAEDNVINQKVITAMLKAMGCECVITKNGIEAIESLRNAKFDLVLMDGQMPLMDGYEATKQIRDGRAGPLNSMVPIIAVTANAIKGDVERCYDVGMNDYIPKPISQSDLQVKIQKWLKIGPGGIDFKMLERLKALESPDNPNLTKEVVKLFLETTPIIITKIKGAWAGGDIELVRNEAHSLKSSCGNVGASRMYEVVSRLEKINEDDKPEMFEGLLRALESDFVSVQESLRGYG